MIEVQDLTKYYGPKVALQDVSFEAARGDILGLLGPNGAGKSTTMRILTGFFPPTSGTARVAGFDVVERSLEVRRRIGYLPENVPLYTDMTVVAYLDFVARAKDVSQRRAEHRVGDGRRPGRPRGRGRSSGASPRATGSGWGWPRPSWETPRC